MESVHRHFYQGATFFQNDHSHRFKGNSDQIIRVARNHCHRILVVCECDRRGGHCHVIEITSGIGIYDRHGRHHHRFSGETSFDGRPRHNHIFDRNTNPAIGYYY